MIGELIVLRIVHVMGGIFWVGSGLFSALFLMPVLMQAGPSAGSVMAGLNQRRLFTALPVVALLTIASGLRLLWIVSGGLQADWLRTPVGTTYTASGVMAIVAFVLALLVVRPAAVQSGALGALLQNATDESERVRISSRLQMLRRRSGVGGAVVLWLLVASAAGMAVARYTSSLW